MSQNDEADFTEDEHAEDVLTQTREEVAAALEADEVEIAEEDDNLDSALATVLDARADRVAEDALSGDDTIDADKALLAGLEPAEEDDIIADDNLFEGQAADDARPRARVIKVKKADMEAAMDAGDIDGPADLARLVNDGLAEEVSEEIVQPESTLTAEAEAELMRELAEVESEFAEAPAEDATAADEAEATPAAHGDIQDDDVTRLMAEADQQMDEPEGSKSRDTFRQLRAAVVARNADEDLKKASEGDGDENAYRSDLAEVVRPRRPAASGGTDARPVRPTAAPLKLVAEQRVDVEQPAPAASGTIVPRRVSAEHAALAADADGGFAEFASEMGANALPDLLEAAAAYMAFVEGREDFSRPQLMHKVRQLDPEDFRREDGLRSFGKLLRDGKIQKLDGGRFAATRDIGFQPRKAAG